MKTITILLIALLFASPVTFAQQPSDNPIDRKQAAEYFAQAKQILTKDGGALWGTSLDGPLIFVDVASRHCVANQQDAKQVLQQVDEVYIGQLPADVMIANTSVDWSGTKWTMCLWTLPEDADARGVLLAHESWHRVQDRLGFPSSGALSEAHNVELPKDLETAVAIRGRLYDGVHLWSAEKRRDDERRALLAGYVKKFTADSRLVLPLVQMKMSFNPNELVPLENLGTVYPTLELTDSWGVLTVTGGALIAADFQSVTVSVPAGYADELSTSTDEWKLELSSGWIIGPEDGGVYRAKQNE